MSRQSQLSQKRKQYVSPEEAGPSRKKSREFDDETPTHRRAGTINRMILKNFMCHSLLEIDFNSNICMVIGKNGSGKSAILTALIIGLGGKASLTNRGSSVKSLVKAGRNSATIEIELSNTGIMAYKPKIYGPTLTIVRHVLASGSCTYKTKSSTGEVISNKAKEVQSIIANLNIQVDNPVCILTQDVSRNFLSSCDPKNLFILFMKATRLDTLESEYKLILSNREETVRMLEVKKVRFEKLQDEINRLKAKIVRHQSIVNLKDKKMNLQKQLLWAQVRDVEDEVNEEQINLKNLENRISGLEGNSEKQSLEVEAINKKIREFERQIAVLREQLQIQKKSQNDIKAQLDELQNAYNEHKRQKQAAEVVLQSKSNDAEYLEKEIAEANENMSKVEQQKKERLNNLEQMRNKLKGFTDQLETAQNELFQLKSDLARKQDDKASLSAEILSIGNKIASTENSLKGLQKESGNVLMIYGSHYPIIKDLIEKNKNKFQHEPRGPLGQYIKLRDKNWAVAVEGYIGEGMLKSFTVDNRLDSQLLQQILAKACQGAHPPSVITSKFIFKKHNVQHNLVVAPKDCVCLYNVIQIDDPIVSNCIVDQRSPENILLIPSNERAMELMSAQEQVPKNCHQALTVTGDIYYPDPNYKTYASRYHRARFLQVDSKEHLQVLKENIASLRTKQKTVESQLHAVEGEMQQEILSSRQLEEKIRKVQGMKNQIRRHFEELSDSAEPAVHTVNYLENELQEVKKTVTEKRALIDKVVEETKEIRAEIQSTEAKFQEIKKSSQKLENRIWPIREEIKENETKLTQLATNDNFAKRHIEQYQRDAKESQARIRVKQTSIKAKMNEASALGDRPNELRKVVDIANELTELTRNISRVEMESENIAEVMDRYENMSEKFNGVSEIMQVLLPNIKELNKAVDERKRHYKLTENYFVTFMKHSFKRILEVRQFKGTMEFNMEDHKLDLVVIPQQGSQGLTSTANLSGGERSFSTVAFLYSLWQCMDFPFYFLDEFDVYMDKMNRTKVIDILLHHANSKPDLQFVFLTPQDVSFVTQKDVSILRLRDPERINTLRES